jgi:hypothetical protein
MKTKYILILLVIMSIISGCSKDNIDYTLIKEKTCQEGCNKIDGLYKQHKVVKENDTYLDLQCSCNIYINITK